MRIRGNQAIREARLRDLGEIARGREWRPEGN